VTGVPLAVAGIVFLAGKIVAATTERTADQPAGDRDGAPSWRRRLAGVPGLASASVVAVLLTLVLVVATRGLSPDDRFGRFASTYDPKNPNTVLVTKQMREFYDRIAEEIPPDAVVAGNPFAGSSLLWALEDRKVLYPHFRNTTSDAQDVVAERLHDLTDDPAVCRAVNDLKVDYLLIGGAEFRPNDRKWDDYAGLSDPAELPGFELVDSSGPSKLYKITGCEPTNRPAG
jgi:hypothetical protein